MKFWNRKNKIEFFNSEASTVENFPIIESKDLKLNWVKRVKENYQKHVKENTINQPGFMHLSRCPGIFDLFKYGYIVPLPKDIMIKPKEKGFDYVTPTPTPQLGFNVHWQSTELIARPPWTADFIVKINTGWNVIVPRGVKFLMLPIAYPDTFDFTATTGVLDPAIQTVVNFQMFWNATEQETIIKAGTPLGHMIPLTEKKYQMVQRNTNQRDNMWIVKVGSATSATFSKTAMRTKITNMYNQYWKR